MNFISSTYIQINNSTKIIIILITENPLRLFRVFVPLTLSHFETNSSLLETSPSFDDASPLLEYLGL